MSNSQHLKKFTNVHIGCKRTCDFSSYLLLYTHINLKILLSISRLKWEKNALIFPKGMWNIDEFTIGHNLEEPQLSNHLMNNVSNQILEEKRRIKANMVLIKNLDWDICRHGLYVSLTYESFKVGGDFAFSSIIIRTHIIWLLAY